MTSEKTKGKEKHIIKMIIMGCKSICNEGKTLYEHGGRDPT